MRVLVGTSGYSYKEWKGRFYPEKMKEADMLRFYAERFSAVEINNTFYRMPKVDLLRRWAEQTPEGFTFVLKAPQRITHQKRLGEVASEVAYLLETAAALGARLGPVLYQLPPYMKKDVGRLQSFLDGLPAQPAAAFEFRHESWSDDEVRQTLRDHGAALCLADTDEEPLGDLAVTAGWGYLRLRRASYTEDDLVRWSERVRAQPWDRAYVFFKHEDEARGPEFAARFMARAGG
ncbi:MAG TPA: DUF72 domain-containing protein [Vicinamibacteria bacterium]|nr:DUF72 domain-containing protein [Vicinamibacteria bacterium]